MKNKARFWLLAISAGMIAFQLGSCARFWGDFIGTTIALSAID